MGYIPQSQSAEAVMQEAKAYTNANLEDLCREMVELGDTGILPEGCKVRELRKIYLKVDSRNDHTMATNAIHEAAMRRVAGLKA
ncbi:hypothetical protein ACYPKM_02400 [Pseudomonas aeruginosa]